MITWKSYTLKAYKFIFHKNFNDQIHSKMGDVRNHTQWGMILKLTVRCDSHRIHSATYAMGT